MARRIPTLVPILGAALLLGALGAAPATAEVGVEVPAFVSPARIEQAAHLEGGHTFSFSVEINFCPTPLLELDHTTLVERPRDGSGKGAAIVTAYVSHPAYEEDDEPCPPEVMATQTVHVRTKRPVADLIFFDGSSSPPRRIYPPLKKG
jgi:hypothetical protein